MAVARGQSWAEKSTAMRNTSSLSRLKFSVPTMTGSLAIDVDQFA
jgi:hypothetical protein